jgi:hypothetical protein
MLRFTTATPTSMRCTLDLQMLYAIDPFDVHAAAHQCYAYAPCVMMCCHMIQYCTWYGGRTVCNTPKKGVRLGSISTIFRPPTFFLDLKSC